MKKDKKKYKKRLNIKDKMIKIELNKEPEYSYLKLISSTRISNYDSSNLSLLVKRISNDFLPKIRKYENRICLEKEKMSTIRYMLDIEVDCINFILIVPKVYKDLAIDTIGGLWNGSCTIIEIKKEDIRVLDTPSVFQLVYKFQDMFSTKTDSSSNQFLSNCLNVVEIMHEGNENLQFIVNLIPNADSKKEWKTHCDEMYDRYKKNLPLSKNIFEIGNIFSILFQTLGGLIDLFIPDSLKFKQEFSLANEVGELRPTTKKKTEKADNIIDVQLVILTKADSKKRELELAESFHTAFNTLKEDNELLLKEVKKPLNNISALLSDFNTSILKMSTFELSNFITVAGKSIIDKFKNIEHNATKEVPVAEQLSTGISLLGYQKYGRNRMPVYLNEFGKYAFMPIMILTMMGGGKSTWFETVGVSLMNNFRREMKKGKVVNKESVFCIDFHKQNEMSYNIMNNIHPDDVIKVDLSTSEGTAMLGLSFLEGEIDMYNDRERISNASRQGKEMMRLVDLLTTGDTKDLSTQMRMYLNSAFQICFIHPNQTLQDAMRIVEFYDIRHKYIDMIPESMRETLDDEVRILLELDTDDGGTKKKDIGGILARVYALKSNPELKEMYNSKPENMFSFLDAMQEGKAVFFLMPESTFDIATVNIITTYITSRLFFACQKRGNIPDDKVVRCTLLIDELDSVPSCLPGLLATMKTFRRYKLRPIFSAHDLGMLKVIEDKIKSLGFNLILPQGSSDKNYYEFENDFKAQGFYINDLTSLAPFETLNLIVTKNGKKAFVSKFPDPVPNKYEILQKDGIFEKFEDFKEPIVKKVEGAGAHLKLIEMNKKRILSNIKDSAKNDNTKEQKINKTKENSLIKESNVIEKYPTKTELNSDNSIEISKDINKIEELKKNKMLSLNSRGITSINDDKKKAIISDLNSGDYDYLFEELEDNDEYDYID